jgi:Uma2 family endonuclease
MTLALPKRATAADLERLSAKGEQYELIEGELVPMPPVGDEQGETTVSLSAEVTVFVRRNGLGRCRGDTGFLIARDPDTVLAPDFSFTTKERVAPRPSRSWGTIIPDLVLENRAPSTSEREAREKMERWLQVGVKVGWDMDPIRRRLTIYQPGQAPVTLGEDDTLTCEELLPGFSLALRDLFSY